jgi:hypothetical protein
MHKVLDLWRDGHCLHLGPVSITQICNKASPSEPALVTVPWVAHLHAETCNNSRGHCAVGAPLDRKKSHREFFFPSRILTTYETALSQHVRGEAGVNILKEKSSPTTGEYSSR